MHNKVFMIILFLAMTVLLLAQETDISISLAPSHLFVNSLNTADFDPVNTSNQPLLTTIMISNVSNPPADFKFYLAIKLKWNNIYMIGSASTYVEFKSKQNLTEITVSSRDLISQNGNPDAFDSPSPQISFQDVVGANQLLEDALYNGYFPDGNLVLEVCARKEGTGTPYTAPQFFTIQIKNAGIINPIYPGKVVGSTPISIVNLRPVAFLWSSNKPEYNTFHLKVKEFPPDFAPGQSNVESQGQMMLDQDVLSNVYSEFLDFRQDYYYAWQVSIPTYDTNNMYSVTDPVTNGQATGPNPLTSSWYVFKYQADNGSDYSVELNALLNALGSPQVQALLNQGYSPSGAIFFNGQWYSGQAALDLISDLLGKQLDITISN